MNTEPSITAKHGITFNGQGTKYFSIVFVNFLLMIVTLGLYYPWAKASKLKYLYENTQFCGSPFNFVGTGKEMFRGFIKLVGILVLVGLIYAYLWSEDFQVFGILMLYIFAFLLVPVALHGSYKYRLSRTTWRGIHFGYRGNLGDLFSEWIIGTIFTVLSLGIYSSWFTVKIRKYMVGNIRFGSAKFHFVGEGSDLFIIHLKGFFFSIFTLGIYLFWYTKNLYNFYIDNIVIEHGDEEYHHMHSYMSGGDFFELFVVNYLIVVFTLGLGFPFAEIRTFKYLSKKLAIDGTFNPDNIAQTEENYTDAAGDDLANMLDLDIA